LVMENDTGKIQLMNIHHMRRITERAPHNGTGTA